MVGVRIRQRPQKQEKGGHRTRSEGRVGKRVERRGRVWKGGHSKGGGVAVHDGETGYVEGGYRVGIGGRWGSGRQERALLMRIADHED
eukprot:356599-Chlamydomonas_euryale.AAC.5